jgi:plastocyanin
MPFRSRRSALSALLLAGSIALAACGGDDGAGEETPEASGPPAAATVNLRPATFEPADVKVGAGETVEWKWAGGVQHDVQGEGFKSKVQSKGTFRHTFPEAGTFDYKCNVHPTTMTGTVTVS